MRVLLSIGGEDLCCSLLKMIADLGTGEAGTVFEVVGWIEHRDVVSLEFRVATVDGFEGLEEFADGMDGLRDGAGGIEGGFGEVTVGADEILVIAGEAADGIVSRLGSSGIGVGRRDGTRESERGDAQGGDGNAGAKGIEAVGEEAVEDLCGHETNGGVVFKEWNGDLARLGEGGMAIAIVGVAEVESAEDVVFAAVAVDGEGSALRPFGGCGLGEGGIEFADGIGNRFRKRLSRHWKSP